MKSDIKDVLVQLIRMSLPNQISCKILAEVQSIPAQERLDRQADRR